MQRLFITHVAVCGASTMGAQIAASFANSGCTTYLFDTKADTCLAQQAINQLHNIHPAPACTPEIAHRIIPANYTDDIALLQCAHLVIESVSESLPLKISLLEEIIPHLQVGTVIGSNTASISIEKLAASLPEVHRPHFLGLHFFDPPRYLTLCECIPSVHTDPQVASSTYRYLTDTLGRAIIVAPDTPNCIANRVSMFTLLCTAQQAERYAIAPEVVDTLTGALLRRPEGGIYQTIDRIGLDRFSHLIDTARQVAHDPWRDTLHLPSWLQARIDAGEFKGLYEQRADTLYVYDQLRSGYRPATQKPPNALLSVMKKACYPTLFSQLYHVNEPHHCFLWATLAELFHYCAWLCNDLSISIHTLDQAMKKGYGWELGPFEMWQQAGVQVVVNHMQHSLVAGRTRVDVALPPWLNHVTDFYQGDQAYHPQQERYVDVPCYTNPRYSSHLIPTITASLPQRRVIHESSHSTLWTQDGKNAIFSIHATSATIDLATIVEAQHALEVATKNYQALIIWTDTAPYFGRGPNLMSLGTGYILGGRGAMGRAIDAYQALMMAVKYAPIPCIAAVRGLALSTSCELMMHCAHRVVSYNSHIGLDYAGIGLVPTAGGCKEMALYAQEHRDPVAALAQYFSALAGSEIATSAQMAKQYGFLRPQDTLIAHDEHILAAAHAQADAMTVAHYMPPARISVAVPGWQGIANLSSVIANKQAGGFMTEHDAKIATAIATVLCGGDITPGTYVDEAYFLALEKAQCLYLLGSWKTKRRFAHTLRTGNYLSN